MLTTIVYTTEIDGEMVGVDVSLRSTDFSNQTTDALMTRASQLFDALNALDTERDTVGWLLSAETRTEFDAIEYELAQRQSIFYQQIEEMERDFAENPIECPLDWEVSTTDPTTLTRKELDYELGYYVEFLPRGGWTLNPIQQARVDALEAEWDRRGYPRGLAQ